MSLDEFILAFRELFPEFDGVSDTLLAIYYDQGLAIFSACNYAMLYLVAHLISIDQANGISGNGSGGSIDGGNGENTSEKVGEIQVNMMAMAESGKETYFTSTPYGRRYLTFRNTCPTRAFSVRCYTSNRVGS